MNNRHMFPGGNTSKGFTNYFEGIFPEWEENKKLYILKGGPGVGKNTLMKELGKRAAKEKRPIEYFHCASDPDSLDAVRIPNPGITMLDGTSPHIVDPKYPGAVDQIYNLGVFLDEAYLSSRKKEIMELNRENSFCYEKTFSCLRAAGELKECRMNIYRKALLTGALQKQIHDMIPSMERKDFESVSCFRKLFYGAFTPAGAIDYSPVDLANEYVFYLDGPLETASLYLQVILSYLEDNGYSAEIFYSPLLPDQPVHVNIRELPVSFTTTKPFSPSVSTIALTDFMDCDFIDRQQEFLTYLETQKELLIHAALLSLKESKQLHDKLEEIYKNGIDFERVSSYSEQILDEIFNHI